MPQTRKCIRCGDEYEPQYWEVGATRILRGAGYCLVCSQLILDEEVKKEELLQEALIIDTRYHSIYSSGIPFLFLTKTFATFDKGWQDKALAYCKKYADEFPIDKRQRDYPSLYLWSAKSWGVGKTHLSCAIALSILYRWVGGDRSCPRIYFVSEPDLFRQIQGTYNYTREEQQYKDSEDDIIRKLVNCDLLILDDVGKEKRQHAEFVQRTLFGLIDGRYKLQLPIVLTANVNADGLERHLQGASFDRFHEMIKHKSVCMDGDSYRRKK